MPELPEVEVVRRGLDRLVTGRTISGYWTDEKPLRRSVPASLMRTALTGASVTASRRRAKYLLIDFDNGATLIIHLGMSGRLGLFAKTHPLLPHDHLCWRLDNGTELRFNDARRFGSVALLTPPNSWQQEQALFADTGPEPLAASFSGDYLHRRSADRKMPVKQFIMDQRIVAGIGNIYANESLFAAGIRPTRPAGSISRRRWQNLSEKIKDILAQAIACGGSTISDFFGTTGEGGYFQVHFAVYGKGGEACPRCARPIKAIRLGGRSTYYCPSCQRA